MTTPYDWPPQLPQTPHRAIPMTIGQNVQRTPMDHGPSHQRRLYTATEDIYQYTVILDNDADHDTFWSWYRDVLQEVNRFNWTHPRTGAAVEMRFRNESMPQSQYFDSKGAPGAVDNYWELSFTVEIPVQ